MSLVLTFCKVQAAQAVARISPKSLAACKTIMKAGQAVEDAAARLTPATAASDGEPLELSLAMS